MLFACYTLSGYPDKPCISKRRTHCPLAPRQQLRAILVIQNQPLNIVCVSLHNPKTLSIHPDHSPPHPCSDSESAAMSYQFGYVQSPPSPPPQHQNNNINNNNPAPANNALIPMIGGGALIAAANNNNSNNNNSLVPSSNGGGGGAYRPQNEDKRLTRDAMSRYMNDRNDMVIVILHAKVSRGGSCN